MANALAILDGGIICFIGLIRFGWIVDLISLPAISAFMTGSALNIAVGQVPALMGISNVSNRDSTYLVVINILKHLNATRLDAAMGLTALAMLYMIRSACNYGARRMPHQKKTFFFISTLRTAFVILLYTMISWLVNMNRRTSPAFKITLDVPRGFQHAGVPTVNATIISSFASQLPSVIIVTLIEHIAIAKSFGRVNNYTINPSQELVAIGVTNLLGPFLGAYPATGSFSRTAIKSKAGVRTPFAGVITALVVLLAIYALPPVFYYIPNSSLAGVIIHAVGDLITPPNTVYQFWCVSPLEVVIFFAGVIVTVFTTIDIGVYVTISTSMAVFLYRAFKAQGRFLGRAKVHSVIGDHLVDNDAGHRSGKEDAFAPFKRQHAGEDDPDAGARNVFLPLTHHDGSNPQIELEKPYPGIFIYRFSEGFNYPNANHYLDFMVETIFKETRRTNPDTYPRPGVSLPSILSLSLHALHTDHSHPQDRPWNQPGPRRGQPVIAEPNKPELKAIILDFASVNNVDITSVQHLIDVRNQLDMYAAPATVDWHFAHLTNRWTKRALASAGFGYPSPTSSDGTFRRWKPVFSVAEIGGGDSAAAQAEEAFRTRSLSRPGGADIEAAPRSDGSSSPDAKEVAASDTADWDKGLAQSKAYGGRGGPTAAVSGRVAVVQGLNRPLFHVDLTSALQSAVANAQKREGAAPKTLE